MSARKKRCRELSSIKKLSSVSVEGHEYGSAASLLAETWTKAALLYRTGYDDEELHQGARQHGDVEQY